MTAAGAGLIDLLLTSGGELVTVLTGAGVDPGVGERAAGRTSTASTWAPNWSPITPVTAATRC